jgi:hypothetical protein
MRSSSLAIALIAIAASVAPAIAAPLIITVPGGNEFGENPRVSPFYDYNVPLLSVPGGKFDPAAAATEAYFAVHHPVRNVGPLWPASLGETLIRTGDSIAGHWIKCQAHYASYNLVTDTYDGHDGLPTPCEL